MSAVGKTLPGWARAVLSGILLAVAATPLCAHTLPISYLYLVVGTNYLHLELTFNPFELNFFSELDTNKNGRLEPAELEGKQKRVTSRILECLQVYVDGKLVKVEVAGLMPDIDSHHATLRAHYAVDASHKAVTLQSSLAAITSGSHVTQVTFVRQGQRQLAQLDLQSSKATFEPLEKTRQLQEQTKPPKRI